MTRDEWRKLNCLDEPLHPKVAERAARVLASCARAAEARGVVLPVAGSDSSVVTK